MTRRIALLAAAVSLTMLGAGAGTAQAAPDLWTVESASGTWCPGQRVPGGFTEVRWDWSFCHQYVAEAQLIEGGPPIIVGLSAQLYPGGLYELVAGRAT